MFNLPMKREREKSNEDEDIINQKIKVIKEETDKNKEEDIKEEKQDIKEKKQDIKEEKQDIKEEKQDIKEEKLENDIKIDLKENYEIINDNNIINIDNNNANGSINRSIDGNCSCPYRCCIYCEYKSLGCCKCLNKIIKCPSCLRISDEERKGILSSQRISIPQIIPESKKKPNFQGIELADLRSRNDLNQSFNNISAPLITPVALPQFNNLENINLNENRENRRLNIIMFILYSILFIFMTILFRHYCGFSLHVTTELYVLIAGLFVLNFSINFHKLLNK
jgi:hypothetical protein